MKMLELAVPDDGKELYRQIAKKAIEGNEMEPKKSVPIQLWEVPVVAEGEPQIPLPTKEAQAKLVNALRSGLAGAGQGRFSVEHKGQIAWVSVNETPAKVRVPRAVKKAAAPKAKAPGAK